MDELSKFILMQQVHPVLAGPADISHAVVLQKIMNQSNHAFFRAIHLK